MRLLFTLLAMALVTLVTAALVLVDLLLELLPLLLVAAAMLIAVHWAERRRRAAHVGRLTSLRVMPPQLGVTSLHHSVIDADEADSRRREPVGWAILPVWDRQVAPRRQVNNAEMISGRGRRD